MKPKNNASNGNDHHLSTPDTSNDKGKTDDPAFTSYDTKRPETSSPQKVRHAIEPEGEQERLKQANKDT